MVRTCWQQWPGPRSLRQQIEIGGGVTKEFELALVPAKGELAHIRVRTPVPGADIQLDGAPVGHTPIDVTLSVEAGSHELALQRKGYRTPPCDGLGEGRPGTRMWRWKKMRRRWAGRQEIY